jgi:hypothetical protein
MKDGAAEKIVCVIVATEAISRPAGKREVGRQFEGQARGACNGHGFNNSSPPPPPQKAERTLVVVARELYPQNTASARPFFIFSFFGTTSRCVKKKDFLAMVPRV